MTAVINYYVSAASAGSDILDLHTNCDEYSISGQQFIVTGNSGVNILRSALGGTLDATLLAGSQDIVFFDGVWADYAKDVTTVSGAIVFTRTVGNLTEKVTVAGGAVAATRDLLVFADGAVVSNNARAALVSDINAATADLGASWDSATTTASPGSYLPTSFDAAVVGYGTDTAGVVFAMPEPGVAHTLNGTSGVDSIYVTAGATVNAALLAGSQDVVNFTGNWADYAKDVTTVSGAIVFTRTVGDLTEKVTVAGGAVAAARDLLVFADGAVVSNNARAALVSDINAATADLGASWDSTTTTTCAVETIALSNAALAAVTNLDVRSDLVLNAGSAVSLVSLASATGLTLTLTDVTDTTKTQTLDLTDAADRALISFADGGTSGTVIRVNPSFDLDFGHQYRIEMSASAFVTAGGVGSQALGATNGIAFTTVTPSTGDTAAASQGYTFSDTNADSIWDTAALGASHGWFNLDRGDADTLTQATGLDFSTGGLIGVAGTITNTGTGTFTVSNDYYAVLTGFGSDDLIYFDDRANDATYGSYDTFDAAGSPIALSTFGAGPDGNELQMGVTGGAQALIRVSLDTAEAGITDTWADSFNTATPATVQSFEEMLGANPVIVA